MKWSLLELNVGILSLNDKGEPTIITIQIDRDWNLCNARLPGVSHKLLAKKFSKNLYKLYLNQSHLYEKKYNVMSNFNNRD